MSPLIVGGEEGSFSAVALSVGVSPFDASLPPPLLFLLFLLSLLSQRPFSPPSLGSEQRLASDNSPSRGRE